MTGTPKDSIWVLRAATVDSWARGAPVGAEIVYAHGPCLPRVGGAIRVSDMATRGIVHPFQRRAGDGHDYVARLLRPAWATRRAYAGDVADARARAVMRWLGQHSRPGEPLPTGAAIAEGLGLDSKRHADRLLHRMRRAGLIDWQLAAAGLHEPQRRVLVRMGPSVPAVAA